jgi:hypothetical protein
VSPQNVELLYFEGCPNHEEARELVERVAAQAGVELSLRLVEVTSPEDAERSGFSARPACASTATTSSLEPTT